jgi:dTDP-4-dehydrorhamnose reductase
MSVATDKSAFLVVGGDSLVGGGLLRALERRGHRAYATTRRSDTLSETRVFLDFENSEPYIAPPDVGYAFIVAAATDHERCENDPLARAINVELIPKLVTSLLELGLFVSFISTNSVFGGERPSPNEDDPHDPQIPNAIQKNEAEGALWDVAQKLNATDRLNIVRLTKILDSETSPLPSWYDAWKNNKSIEPFSDLIFAPISVQFAGEALATIGEKRVAGNLHLSGAENISYVAFAEAIAKKMEVNPALLAPTTATAKGVNLVFKPTYSCLGMKRTSELTGIQPQTLSAVVDDLLV